MTTPAEGNAAPAPGTNTTVAAQPGTFATVMANIRAKAAQGERLPPRDGQVAAPDAKKVEIPGDDVQIKRISRLEAENLTFKERIAALEPAEKDAAVYRQAMKLIGEGKKLEAVSLLAGEDPTGFMEELLAAHLEKDMTPEQRAEAEANLAKAVDDDLKKRVDALEKAKADEKAAAEAREQAANSRARFSFAQDTVRSAKNDDGTPRFDLCGRPENQDGVERLMFGWTDDKGVRHEGHVGRLAIKRQLKNEDVTPELARELILEAAADIEAELVTEGAEQQKAWDARYGEKTATPSGARVAPQQNLPRVTPPGNGTAQEPQREPQPRPMPKPTVRVGEPQPAWSLDAVLAKNRERARY